MDISTTPSSIAAVHADVQSMRRVVDATVLALLDLAELVKPKEEPARSAFQASLQNILTGLEPTEEARRAILQGMLDT